MRFWCGVGWDGAAAQRIDPRPIFRVVSCRVCGRGSVAALGACADSALHGSFFFFCRCSRRDVMWCIVHQCARGSEPLPLGEATADKFYCCCCCWFFASVPAVVTAVAAMLSLIRRPVSLSLSLFQDSGSSRSCSSTATFACPARAARRTCSRRAEWWATNRARGPTTSFTRRERGGPEQRADCPLARSSSLWRFCAALHCDILDIFWYVFFVPRELLAPACLHRSGRVLTYARRCTLSVPEQGLCQQGAFAKDAAVTFDP